MQMRANEVERAAIERQQGGFCEWPAKPCRGKAKRRWRRHSHHFGRGHLACKLRPNSIKEGVARGEDADPFWAFAQHIGYGAPKRGGPNSRSSMDQGGSQSQMALSAEYNLGALDQGPGGGR